LVVAGVATAYALFTKGALVPFVPAFAVFLSLAAWRAGAGASEGRARLARALAPAAVYVLATALVLLPQLVHNAREGYGLRLAANRWWNLEVGLASGEHIEDVNRRYWDAAADPIERERLSRERTLEHVRELGPARLLVQQARKLAALVFEKPAELEASLHREQRWGDPPPRWIAALELPGRILWYGLLVLGALGCALRGTRSPGWALLLVFSLLYLVSLLAVPVKLRFTLPLVPALCLFSAASIEELARRIRARRAHRPARPDGVQAV
jgi:hypothetical protein